MGGVIFKNGQRIRVSQCAMCTIGKLPHSYTYFGGFHEKLTFYAQLTQYTYISGGLKEYRDPRSTVPRVAE